MLQQTTSATRLSPCVCTYAPCFLCLQAVALHLLATLVSADKSSTVLAEVCHREKVPKALLDSVVAHAEGVVMQHSSKAQVGGVRLRVITDRTEGRQQGVQGVWLDSLAPLVSLYRTQQTWPVLLIPTPGVKALLLSPASVCVLCDPCCCRERCRCWRGSSSSCCRSPWQAGRPRRRPAQRLWQTQASCRHWHAASKHPLPLLGLPVVSVLP